MKNADMKNRTFVLGIISSTLFFVSLAIILCVVFGIKTYWKYNFKIINFCLMLIFASFVLGTLGLTKAKKGWIGKILCIIPVTSFCLLAAFLLWIFIGVMFPHKLSAKKDLRRTSEILETDLSGGKYLKRIETHCGLLYDGDYYAQIKFSEPDKILESIKNNPHWKNSALPQSLLFLLYEDEPEDFLCLITDERMKFPRTDRYFYFFINRSDECEDPENRNPDYLPDWEYSLNFTVALLDLNTNILYIYELDT